MKTNPIVFNSSNEQSYYTLLLMRVVASVLLVFSASYWALLVGISDSATRFDSMSTSWQLAAASLVVLQPVAALGLWGGWRWGVVMWVFVAAIEFTMYGIYPDIFGEANFLLIFHAVGILAYICMALFLNAKSESVIEED
ncbi:MAG: DUF6163 family protein [Rhizobiaceae bacterium]